MPVLLNENSAAKGCCMLGHRWIDLLDLQRWEGHAAAMTVLVSLLVPRGIDIEMPNWSLCCRRESA